MSMTVIEFIQFLENLSEEDKNSQIQWIDISFPSLEDLIVDKETFPKGDMISISGV